MLTQPRRWGRWILLAIALIFLFKAPHQAAILADQGWVLAGHLVDALAQFVSGLHT